jgi:hypothetical protein
MPRKSKWPVGHTGQTEAGHTRDVKVERVTIYKQRSAKELETRWILVFAQRVCLKDVTSDRVA